MTTFPVLADALQRAGVRFVLIGTWGANLHARDATAVFTTFDFDLFLPPEPDTLLGTWRVCEELGLSLHVAGEPLDRPRDRALAEQAIAHRATVRATAQSGLAVDLTLVMTAFDFEEVWRNRRVFAMDGFDVPVARLRHIIESKGATAREKDRLFLATHRAALREMLGDDTD